MNVYALQTAQGENSKPFSLKGRPLYVYSIFSAYQSKLIKNIYVATDNIVIKNAPYNQLYKVVSAEGTDSQEAILHGLLSIEEDQQEKCDILVILFPNSLGSHDLDEAIQLLVDNEALDSVQSVSEFKMFNPTHACYINDEGLLASVKTEEKETVYFFNGSFLVCRRNSIVENNGALPYSWLGKNVAPFVQRKGMQKLEEHWQEALFNQEL